MWFLDHRRGVVEHADAAKGDGRGLDLGPRVPDAAVLVDSPWVGGEALGEGEDRPLFAVAHDPPLGFLLPVHDVAAARVHRPPRAQGALQIPPTRPRLKVTKLFVLRTYTSARVWPCYIVVDTRFDQCRAVSLVSPHT